MNDRVNESELLLNAVKKEPAKRADKLDPKGTEASSGAPFSPDADDALPVNKQYLRRSGIFSELGKPNILSLE